MKFYTPLLVLAITALLAACSADATQPEPDTAGIAYADAASDPFFGVDDVAVTADDIEILDDVQMLEDIEMPPQDVGPEEPDVVVAPDVPAPTPDIVEPDPDAPPVDLNLGWIGGPCPDDLACDYESGTCLLDSEGFQDGHCSRPCDLYCPDQDGAATTFCVNPSDIDLDASGGWCVMQCDFGLSPTGCRDGYYCGAVERYGEPETVKFACLPGEAPTVEMTDCMLELVERGIGFHVGVNPMDSPDGHPDLICDVTDPVWVDGTLSGVNYRYASMDGEVKRVFAACELALAMHDTATLVAAEGVTDIVHVGVYNCRVISGTSKISQHGYANAIDIKGFQFQDGTHWTVFDDWEDGVADPLTDGGDWLLWFANELYVQWLFNIVLTPEYNAAHDDHFHCDLTPESHSLH